MPITFNNAVSGLAASAARLAASATNIANASSRDERSKPVRAVRAEPIEVSGNGQGLGVRTEAKQLTADYQIDLATELVESKQAEISYQANAKLIKAAKEMEDRLLDELV